MVDKCIKDGDKSNDMTGKGDKIEMENFHGLHGIIRSCIMDKVAMVEKNRLPENKDNMDQVNNKEQPNGEVNENNTCKQLVINTMETYKILKVEKIRVE
ncbi:hypothetical protein Tco_0868524 [Tanacetum coccineum]